MIFLRQSTASQEVLLGPFVDSTDGVTAETALTIANTDVKIWKSGATTEANKNSGGATHIASGRYYIVLDATDTDTVGGMQIHVAVSGALPVKLDVHVVEETVYDSLFAASADNNAAVIATVDTVVDSILVDTAEIGAAGAGLTAVPWNASWDAEVQSEVNDGLVALGLDHLLAASVAGTDVVDNSIMARIVSSSATADWDDFVNTTDSLQALRDRGDAAWTTGGGGSISDIIQWQPLVPLAIDLANTAAYQIGIALTNQLDDLPTTAEITPGTISIDRKAQGGTSWSSVVADAAMTEIDGLVYYDEVFDTATGYAAGDMLRVTFKNLKVTVSANDYVVIGATGRIFYTGIVADTPDVNVAQINGNATAAATLKLFTDSLNPGTGQIDDGTLAADTIQATKIQNGALTGAKQGTAWVTNIQSGLATAAALTTVDTVVDTINANLGSPVGVDISADIAAVKAQTAAIETDTQDIQSRLPASLNNGVMQADIQRINDVALVGDGSGTPFTV